jgi:hypothetical protein
MKHLRNLVESLQNHLTMRQHQRKKVPLVKLKSRQMAEKKEDVNTIERDLPPEAVRGHVKVKEKQMLWARWQAGSRLMAGVK